MATLYVIEARTHDGALDLKAADPVTVFGIAAITGISEDAMAKVIFRQVPDATLDGREIALWPGKINPAWRARAKTW